MAGLTFGTLDRATLAYAGLVAGVTLTRWELLARPWPVLIASLLLGTAALIAPRARAAGALGSFLGVFYPLIAGIALYAQVGLLNVARGVSQDALVQSWEQALFGLQPSLRWMRAQPWPWLAFLMHLGYLSYYGIIVAATLGPWLRERREAAQRCVRLVMNTFYLCYASFLFFPVAGPRFEWPLPDNAATRTTLARFTYGLVGAGSAWGTAFPSSHVAVALVAAWAARREWPALGNALLTLACLLALGTVYGQFHYAVDGMAGAALAGAVLAVDRRAGIGRLPRARLG